jgi:uncharacterized protein (DUF1800 family)
MSLSRRDFLKLGGLAATAVSVSACSRIGSELARRDLPASLAETAVSAAPDDPLLRLLQRAGYGPRPGDLAQARQLGFEAYLEQQLHPDQSEDTAADLVLRGLSYPNMGIDRLLALEEPAEAGREFGLAAISRALLSRRQLQEAMVEFWSDHFHIYVRKNRRLVLFKIVDDREVIRPHALGRFPDLLRASARSPAMLIYLDNARNVAGRPNENYARELMELHTMGVDGGYTQKDVAEVARALTGWSVARRGPIQGDFRFYPEQHDTAEKEVLGQTLPAGRGEADVHDVLDILASHPATAEFIATKLARRFVADAPPPALVARVAERYRETGGEIKAMLRTIFHSEEFAAAPPKLKRPYTFMVSALRALNATVRPTILQAERQGVGVWLRRLGQPLFQWPAPDGYPDVAAAWSDNLLPRWNFALALLHGRVPGVDLPLEDLVRAGEVNDATGALDLFAGLILNRPLDPSARQQFTAYVGGNDLADRETRQRLRDAVALMLAGPAFQWM